MKRLTLLACALFFIGASGCRTTRPAGTSIRLKDSTKEEEVRIRRQEWMVMKAVQEVAITYDLLSVDLEIVLEEQGGLGETQPDFDYFLRVDGATVSINKLLLAEENPEKQAILLGLFSHELGHALHYTKLSELDLIILGEKYERFYLDPTGHLKPWAVAYEQFTDLTAIAHGYGTPLIQQKIRTQDLVSRNHPPKIWNFYLKPDEIARLMNDREALRAKIHETLAVIDLESLSHFGQSLSLAGIPLRVE